MHRNHGASLPTSPWLSLTLLTEPCVNLPCHSRLPHSIFLFYFDPLKSNLAQGPEHPPSAGLDVLVVLSFGFSAVFSSQHPAHTRGRVGAQ